jgi:hypothetical protein
MKIKLVASRDCAYCTNKMPALDVMLDEGINLCVLHRIFRHCTFHAGSRLVKLEFLNAWKDRTYASCKWHWLFQFLVCENTFYKPIIRVILFGVGFHILVWKD